MVKKEYTWFKISDGIHDLGLSSGGMVSVEINNKQVCIIQSKEGIVGCTAKCPHAGGDLVEGYVDALGNLVCPLHHYKFNLRNGRNITGEGYFLKTFPVEIRNEGIFIGFEENQL